MPYPYSYDIDLNALPQSLDAVYNAYMAQQDRDRRGKLESLEYGKPLAEIGEADIQAHIARKRLKEQESSEMLNPQEQALVAQRLGVDPSAVAGVRRNVLGSVMPQTFVDPTTERTITAAPGAKLIPRDAAAPKAAEKSAGLESALNLYETARKGLIGGLEGSTTGPILGRMPAFTAKQQIAEGGVAAMAPVLKQLFRVSGEGVFTDRDQQLLLDMIPTRKTRPEAWKPQIENIDRIVKAKLGMSQSARAGGATQMAQPQAPGGAQDPRTLVKQLAAQGMSRDQIKAELQRRGL